MKLLAYLLLVGKTTALSAAVSIVDAATNQTAPTLTTPESSTSLALAEGKDYDEDWAESFEGFGQALVTMKDDGEGKQGTFSKLKDKIPKLTDDQKKKLKKVQAGVGCIVAVINIVKIWTDKMPKSPLEKQVDAAVETITKKMEAIHKEQMAEMSQIGRNQFFLHAVDKIETLEQLTRVQLAFRNTYNKRAVEFVCGEQASRCSDAFRNWASALTRRFDQLIKDGSANEWNGLINIGYNAEKIKGEIDLTVKQLNTYPTALQFAISGAAAYDARQANDKELPSPDFVSQLFTDEIGKKADSLLSYIDDKIYPYLMNYQEQHVKFGDRGGEWQKREDKLEHMIKGYHQDKDTYLGSIHKLIWAHNPSMVHLGTSHRNCWQTLDHNGGECYCYKNTWLRGNRFTTSGADHIKHFIPGWEESFCNYFGGWFHSNCENIDGEGKNKVTVCPKNKFWVGVKRDNGPGLDQIKYRCCEAVYAKPLTGTDPLPAEYKDKDGKVSFQHGDVFLRMHDTWADMKSKTYGAWERFTIQPVIAEKGLYKLINHQGAELSCFGPDDNRLGKTDKSVIHKEFQFIEKDGGYAIYNPHMSRFVGPYNGGDAGCHDIDFKKSIGFFGPKRAMAIEKRLSVVPNLFRTVMTAPGEGNGWGFKRSYTSKWLAFFSHNQGRWLKADKNGVLMGYRNNKPGAWEKFEIKQIGSNENAVFALKSFHGKYIRCMPDGSIKADHADKPYDWEKFIIYQQVTNGIKIYNPTHGRYIIMSQDGGVHCNERLPEHATEWSTPTRA